MAYENRGSLSVSLTTILNDKTPELWGARPIGEFGIVQKWQTNRLDCYNSFSTTYRNGVEVYGYVQPIYSYWRSKAFNIGYGTFKTITLYLDKSPAGIPQEFPVISDDNIMSVKWSIDGHTWGMENVDLTVGQGGMIRKTIDINQQGAVIQIELEHIAEAPFIVYGIIIDYNSNLPARIV